jgi:hypothetical protein
LARLISDILNAPEPAFTHELRRLEALAGYPKVDVRLVSELTSSWKALAGELGLDSNDTTAKELYFALQKRVKEENAELSRKLGLDEKDTPEKTIRACAHYVQAKLKVNPVWVLKGSIARSQLKVNKPKKMLKILGLRSIDSAIKREPLSELTIFAQMVESKTWHDTNISQAAKVKTTDFDRKPIEISIIDEKRSEKMRDAGYSLNRLIYKDEETGSIIMIVPKRRFPCDALFFIDSLLREANAIRRWSAFAKYLSVRPDFAQWLALLRSHNLDFAAAKIFKIGWSPMHKWLDTIAREEGSPPFEPHLDHEDVRLHSLQLNPLSGYKHIIFKSPEGLVVSCNISDVITNTANGAATNESILTHGKRELYDELFSRYLKNERILQELLKNQP